MLNKPGKDSLNTATTIVDASAPGSSAEGWGWHGCMSRQKGAPLLLLLLLKYRLLPMTHGWGTHEDGSSTWDGLLPAPSMFIYIGCASLPLTHASVCAERGVREILAIRLPMDIFASTHADPIGPLHPKLATVVLGPWHNANCQRS